MCFFKELFLIFIESSDVNLFCLLLNRHRLREISTVKHYLEYFIVLFLVQHERYIQDTAQYSFSAIATVCMY